MWKFLVKQQKIEVLEREIIADHQISFVNLKFTFDGDWKKFHKVVQFSQCDEIYNIVLGFDGTSCKLPAELHAGAVKMSVFGYDAESDTTVRATTVPITLNIRPSGFVGDDDTPIPPTPDLYTQLLQKISEIQSGVNGKDGLSAYEIAKENGFAGTVSEWLESLKGADGRDGIDGVTPDMSEYPKTTAVENIIETQLAPILESGHDHENKDILDATTASYTTEEQQKLSRIDPADYATKEELEQESLSIREAMIPLTRELHSHQNKDTLDALTPELFADLQSLQQFEDSTQYDIQTINEELLTLNAQRHTHDNKTVLDSITAEKITLWDSVATVKLQINGLSTELTVFKGKCDNNAARISTNETDIDSIHETLVGLQEQIDQLKHNGYTVLFENGSDAIRVYGYYIGFVLNGGFFTMEHFCERYTQFCCLDNHYAMYYGQEDFNWDAQILTCLEKRLKLSENSKIQFRYTSGATEDGLLYLINPPGGKIDVPITLYARSEIDNGRAIQLDFQWLQTEKFITTETDCTGIQSGEYYLAWVGRSNNTHPMIQSVKVLEATT